METNYSFSSYAESGDSSPRSREIDGENTGSWDDPVPPPAAAAAAAAAAVASHRVKLMVSFGGRIQPRPHDNQLSYVGGDTKILAVDRSVRLPAVLARLSAISGADDLCLKYQLPGEDLDALVSVTNDEDLEHMMLEYDRLCRAVAPGSKGAPRLRLFVFPITPSQPASGPVDSKSDRQWFVDALNSIAVPPPAPTPAVASPTESPDFLFGLDKGFVPPPAVKVKDPLPEFAEPEPVPVEVPHARSDLAKEDRPVAMDSAVEVQRQIQELQKLQIAENQDQTAFQRKGNDETLTRPYTADYYLPPRVPEKAPQVPPSVAAQIPAAATAYWSEPLSMAAGGRYTSVAVGDRPVYLISAAAGVYPPPPSAAQPQTPQGYYTTAVPRVVAPPPEVYREAAQMYAVSAPPPAGAAAKLVASYAEGGVVRTQAVEAGYGAPAPVAYDSAGRAVYYAGAVPTYQTVASGAINTDVKVVKPSQVS